MKWTKIFKKSFWENLSWMSTLLADTNSDVKRLQSDLSRVEQDLSWMKNEIGKNKTCYETNKRRIDYLELCEEDNWKERFPRATFEELERKGGSIYATKNETLALLNISDSYLNNLKVNGYFEGIRVGRRIFYKRDSIAKFLETHHQSKHHIYVEND